MGHPVWWCHQGPWWFTHLSDGETVAKMGHPDLGWVPGFGVDTRFWGSNPTSDVKLSGMGHPVCGGSPGSVVVHPP